MSDLLSPTAARAAFSEPPRAERPVPSSARPVAAPPLRIRTGHSYHVYFTIALGQRNARFVERAMTPLNRYFAFADSFALTPEPGFDAIHAWNAVPLLTRRPFILTFEDYMPRTPDDRRIPWVERALTRILLGDRCRGLVATSDYALRQFRWQHRANPRLPELLAKTERLYPVTPPRRDRPKPHSDRLRLLFVGRDFMRKGGPALMEAHARLRAQGVPVETTVVSALQWSPRDYIGPPDAAYVADCHARLDQEGVIWHRSLPSAEVHRLMDAADYLIFPTFHDTFGFVTLEAFAGATPVIASDTCVLPELIVPGENGFLLPFENDGIGKWSWLYRQAEAGYLEAYRAQAGRLAEGLVETLGRAWEGRRDYERLSAGALAAAQTRFHPDTARRRLEILYERFRA
ncbi:glycosyltransferase family 4 protein [Cereibacter johrii]|uniref:Glycosyltransferase involved in cell wall biosynthesis n=1 Tax=Cereibacter johrii TaxID=445629 RepID=A0ABX5J7D8_9RHOB|nr:glycosyltransferase family 4 protein [Cereibacter johrii]ODM41737.1 glycosyl transferase family 1 [Cereibacter johrii]PTM75527.1 glycosyltransferase involved in cell wall biosynthesis [Cereibacter johrii]